MPFDASLPHRRERRRRQLARLVFLFYGLLLAEGPLRKWLLPGASNALVFVRDPVMLAILAAYIRLGPSPATRRVCAVLGAVALALALCVVCQAAATDVTAGAILAGLRNYILFAPLLIVIPDAFTAQDYARWVTLNLWLAIPVAALVAVQYGAGPTAVVNAVPGGNNDGVFLLVDDVVRPYGLFSFTLGHSAYAAWMAGVGLAAFVARKPLGLSGTLLVLGGCSIALMGALSGSRTYILFAGSVAFVFGGGAMLFGTPAVKRSATTAGVAGALALTAIMLIRPAILTDLLDRQATAVASEGSTALRLISVVTDFADEMSRAPLFGYGLGSGTNVANFLANGRTDHVLAEYELTRIVQELGPVFGTLVIGLRWGLVAWLAAGTLRVVRRTGNLQPLCVLGFVAPVFIAHDVTLQNSMIGIGWFSAGMLLCSMRVGPATAPLGARVPRSVFGREALP